MTLKALKERLSADPGAQQLLAVECTGGSNAIVRYYIKADGSWEENNLKSLLIN